MWLLFGLGAIVFAFINLIVHFQGKDAGKFRFLSMALTILTLCDFYGNAAQRVKVEDWAGLMDILPTVSLALWICSISSIILNSISLFAKKK